MKPVAPAAAAPSQNPSRTIANPGGTDSPGWSTTSTLSTRDQVATLEVSVDLVVGFNQKLDRAVPVVADPAGQPERIRLAPHEGAETDSLNAAGNKVPLDPGLHISPAFCCGRRRTAPRRPHYGTR
jgi:hypothetical protein